MENGSVDIPDGTQLVIAKTESDSTCTKRNISQNVLNEGELNSILCSKGTEMAGTSRTSVPRSLLSGMIQDPWVDLCSKDSVEKSKLVNVGKPELNVVSIQKENPTVSVTVQDSCRQTIGVGSVDSATSAPPAATDKQVVSNNNVTGTTRDGKVQGRVVVSSFPETTKTIELSLSQVSSSKSEPVSRSSVQGTLCVNDMGPESSQLAEVSSQPGPESSVQQNVCTDAMDTEMSRQSQMSCPKPEENCGSGPVGMDFGVSALLENVEVQPSRHSNTSPKTKCQRSEKSNGAENVIGQSETDASKDVGLQPDGSYRMTDPFEIGISSDSDDTDSDSSSSSSSSSSTSSVSPLMSAAESDGEDEVAQDVEEEKPKKMRKKKMDLNRTKGEMFPEDLPPIQDLQIEVDENVEMVEIGKVTQIVGILAVIQADPDTPPLNMDSVLFTEEREPLGEIFETFGRVASPFYTLRFNSKEHMDEKNVEIGMQVFCAPSEKEYTKFVFVNDLKKSKGSDASWENNNEPPDKYLDYSDDEGERRARAKQRPNENESGSGSKARKLDAWPPEDDPSAPKGPSWQPGLKKLTETRNPWAGSQRPRQDKYRGPPRPRFHDHYRDQYRGPRPPPPGVPFGRLPPPNQWTQRPNVNSGWNNGNVPPQRPPFPPPPPNFRQPPPPIKNPPPQRSPYNHGSWGPPPPPPPPPLPPPPPPPPMLGGQVPPRPAQTPGFNLMQGTNTPCNSASQQAPVSQMQTFTGQTPPQNVLPSVAPVPWNTVAQNAAQSLGVTQAQAHHQYPQMVYQTAVTVAAQQTSESNQSSSSAASAPPGVQNNAQSQMLGNPPPPPFSSSNVNPAQPTTLPVQPPTVSWLTTQPPLVDPRYIQAVPYTAVSPNLQPALAAQYAEQAYYQAYYQAYNRT